MFFKKGGCDFRVYLLARAVLQKAVNGDIQKWDVAANFHSTCQLSLLFIIKFRRESTVQTGGTSAETKLPPKNILNRYEKWF